MKRNSELKRTGFKQPTYAEVVAKRKVKKTRPPVDKVAKKKKDRLRKAKVLKELRDLYDLPTITCSRYGTTKSFTRTGLLQGMLWAVFSAYIRKRDADDPCISCSKIKERKQAGHYVPAGGNSVELMFNELNVNGECEECNAFDQFHLVPMRVNLIEKYEVHHVEELERLKALKGVTKWDEQEWAEKIIHYYNLIN